MNRGWKHEGWRHSLAARGVRTYRKYKERLPGGLSSGMSPKNFDPVQLDKGEKVELEHTSDKAIAREISQDHLAENPNYYKELEKIESKDPGLVAKANGVPIYAKRLESGYVYPITPHDAKKVLEKQGEHTKGIKAVKFVMPKDAMQKDAYAQYVRSKREILIFAQKKKGDKISGEEAGRLRELIKSYVVPHEVGHHVSLYRMKKTDTNLNVAEARADAHAAGMGVMDRDVEMFVKR